MEYNNSIIEDFCANNNIKYIKSRPHHPQTNGVVEVVHIEIRKYVILKYAEECKEFDLNNILLELLMQRIKIPMQLQFIDQ